MAFARWDPLRDLLAIQQRLDRFAPDPSGWKPPVDLLETPDQYVVTAELPGVDREDLRIDLQDGRLTVSGSRRNRGIRCEQYHRLELGHGSFSRTFQLPVAVDPSRITADLRNGVLTVTCPKASDPSTRRIHVT